MGSLSMAVFETHVEDTSGPQIRGKVSNGCRQAVGRNMKEGGAGPDTVEFVVRAEILESSNFHWLSNVLGGLFGNFRYSVDGMDGVTLVYEVPAVPAAAAAGIQDGTATGNKREEFGVESGEVQFGCAVDKVGGIISVEREGIGHWRLF